MDFLERVAAYAEPGSSAETAMAAAKARREILNMVDFSIDKRSKQIARDGQYPKAGPAGRLSPGEKHLCISFIRPSVK